MGYKSVWINGFISLIKRNKFIGEPSSKAKYNI